MLNAQSFRKYNLITGWIVFLITAVVYCMTIEPTASFWDCGEYIACSYHLETGHPPGAPFFLLIGRLFSLFSFGKPEYVAACINTMSALASAFTALFLFWSVTHLARKVLRDDTKMNFILVLGAGAVGALSYAFTDSAWFSAEEGEVYALSSLFTAIVFWAMLKWENVADDPGSDRWLIFIAYMIGLSIGVHLLNLLTIPALVFIYYFRKRKVTVPGVIGISVIALLLLGGVQDVLIPGIVNLSGKTELFFVNTLGFSFNSGTIFYFSMLVLFIVSVAFFTVRQQELPLKIIFIIIAAVIAIFVALYSYDLLKGKASFGSLLISMLLLAITAGGLYLSLHRRFRVLNTAVLCFAVLLIGYSSFFVLVIRAQAGTPINEDDPSNAISMLAYLNREQYGDWPLLYGQNFNTPLDEELPYKDGEPFYVRDEKSGKYIVSDARKAEISNYDSRGCTFFPRMYSSAHAQGYQSWVSMQGHEVIFTDKSGKVTSRANIPTLADNVQFFITYQCTWMYARYFAWNFIGRQNDHLGYGGETDGNFLTGIKPMDDARLGEQARMPKIEKENKARNRYFWIPFLLGIAGAIWHFRRAKQDAVVITLLFLFTGLAIVLYLNQTPWQPRERDYAYVGSFYAFSIWIGLGVPGLVGLFQKMAKPLTAVTLATVLGFFSPLILLAQNWDDHNRAGRTVARDIGVNFLESCAPNAVLFTYADNDTFPLWYAQEVLGVRRDVRIICLSLFRSDWYIDQAKKKQYTSDPLPISLTHWQYREGTRDYMSIFEDSQDTIELSKIVDDFSSEDFSKKFVSTFNDTLNFIPTRNIRLTVDKNEFLRSSTLNAGDEKNIPDAIYFRLRGNYLLKDQLIILDFLAHNHWKRPVYFAANMPVTCYAGLDNYLQLEGLAYRFVPVTNRRPEGSLQFRPQVQLQRSYDLLTHQFSYGGLKDPSVYADETVARMFAEPMRMVCAQTATALAEAGRKKEALDVIRKCSEEIPANQVAPDANWIEMVSAAYLAANGNGEGTAQARELARKLAREAFEYNYDCVNWYSTLYRQTGDLGSKQNALITLVGIAQDSNDPQLANEFLAKMKTIHLEMPPEPEPVNDSLMDSIPDTMMDTMK